jgi:1-deoxy-D-xylulose-5-phosphate reductoisomerase
MDGMKRRVAVLGSTGSVGVSTLDLMNHADLSGEAEIEVSALVAGRNIALLAEQARRWRPDLAVVADDSQYHDLKALLAGEGIEVAAGQAAVIDSARSGADWVMSAIVGAAGLEPTLAAAEAGAVIALANKEALVCAGPALLEIVRRAGGKLIPVDSEHSAIFQVLQPERASRVERLILTASGGPFRTWTAAQMAAASPQQAVAHPNWSMGAKISVDSATMMNKGLEMIEAAYLFAMPPEKIEVLIHPQSVIHSLVEYKDGSTLAQLGPPDMRAPIACAFAWPDRLAWPAPQLNLAQIGSLTFEAPDHDRFPAIALAKSALERGGAAPTALNAANEIAVAAFLARRIGFLDITSIVSETLDRIEKSGEIEVHSLGALEAARGVDAAARRIAAEVLPQFERL